MDVPRLKQVVTFTYRPGPAERFVVPHFIPNVALEAKEIVFKLVVLPETSFDETGRAWAFSTSLSSRYSYSPSAEPGAVVRLPGIRLSAPTESLTLTPVRWTSAGSSPDELLSELWTIREVRAGAEDGAGLQATRMWDRR